MMQRSIDLWSSSEMAWMLQHPYHLCRYLFVDHRTGGPLEITPTQEDIIRAILLKQHDNLLVYAVTRWGKSLSIALGCLLRAMLFPGEVIPLIGPTQPLSQVLMEHILTHIGDHPDIVSSLALSHRTSNIQRLREQMAKHHITFTTGSEIRILTAGINVGGRTLLGRGGGVVVVDEAEQIPTDIVKNFIIRMGEESRGEPPMFIYITNPIRKGFMYEHRGDPDYTVMRIDWRVAVREGRLSPGKVEKARREMLPEEFRAWYEADYPDDTQRTLIRRDWILEAENRQADRDDEVLEDVVGVAPAGRGADLAVLTHIRRFRSGFIRQLRILEWPSCEIPELSRAVERYMEEQGIQHVIVDDTGLNSLTALLRERHPGWLVEGINFGERSYEDNLKNMKAEIYMNLRSCFKDGKIGILRYPPLRGQLNNLQYEITADRGRIRVVDGQAKSPDHADALALACYARGSAEVGLGSVRLYTP